MNCLKLICFLLFCFSASALDSLDDPSNPLNVSINDREEFRVLDVVARQINKAINLTMLKECDSKRMTDYDYQACLLAKKIDGALGQAHGGTGSVALALARDDENDGWLFVVATERLVDEEIIRGAIKAWLVGSVHQMRYLRNNDKGVEEYFLDKRSKLIEKIKVQNNVKNPVNLLGNLQRDVDIAYLAWLFGTSEKSLFAKTIVDILESDSKLVVLKNNDEEHLKHAEILIAEYLFQRGLKDALDFALNKKKQQVSITYIGGSIKNCKKCAISLRGEGAKHKNTFHPLNEIYAKEKAMVYFTQGNFSTGYPRYELPSWISGSKEASLFLDQNSTPSKEVDSLKLFCAQSFGRHSFTAEDFFEKFAGDFAWDKNKSEKAIDGFFLEESVEDSTEPKRLDGNLITEVDDEGTSEIPPKTFASLFSNVNWQDSISMPNQIKKTTDHMKPKRPMKVLPPQIEKSSLVSPNSEDKPLPMKKASPGKKVWKTVKKPKKRNN